jgi:hypothetical protein
MEIGTITGIEIKYYGKPSVYISQEEIERMAKAKDALEMLSYALTIAKELNKLNERTGVK